MLMLEISCVYKVWDVYLCVVCPLFTKEMRYSASSAWSNIVALEM